MPLPSLASFVKLSQPQPNLFVQYITYISEPSGNKQFDTTKSSKSMIPVPAPSGSMFDQRLNPNAQGSDNTMIAIQHMIEVLFLSQPVRSLTQASIFSMARKALPLTAVLNALA